MKTTTWRMQIGAAALASLGAWSLPAAAEEAAATTDTTSAHYMDPARRAERMAQLAEELGITDEQRQTIRGLMDSARPNLEATGKQVYENLEMLRVTNPDHPQYTVIVARVSQSMGELTARSVTDLSQLRAQIWAVLTDAQRNRLAELEAEYRERMRERWAERSGELSPGS